MTEDFHHCLFLQQFPRDDLPCHGEGYCAQLLFGSMVGGALGSVDRAGRPACMVGETLYSKGLCCISALEKINKKSCNFLSSKGNYSVLSFLWQKHCSTSLH